MADRPRAAVVRLHNPSLAPGAPYRIPLKKIIKTSLMIEIRSKIVPDTTQKTKRRNNFRKNLKLSRNLFAAILGGKEPAKIDKRDMR